MSESCGWTEHFRSLFAARNSLVPLAAHSNRRIPVLSTKQNRFIPAIPELAISPPRVFDPDRSLLVLLLL